MTPTHGPEEALKRTALLVRQDIYPELDDATIVAALTGTRVCLRADEANLATAGGQTALVTCALMCAQLGVELILDFPETPMLAPQPPLVGAELRAAITEATADVITPARLGDGGDMTILLGDTQSRKGAPSALRLSGGDWRYTLQPATRPAQRWSGDLPFGPAYAAVAASAEVFRYVLSHLGAATGRTPLPEHPLILGRPVDINLTPLASVRHLGSVDIISAGALSTNALYLLLRIPSLQGLLRVIDDDLAALSNLNRYLLLHRQGLGQRKANWLASFTSDILTIEPLPLRLTDETIPSMLPLAEKVLVGVDHIPSRWLAQQHAPEWLGVAATSHFLVVVSEHSPESPCAACLHPRDDEGGTDDIPTVSFVSAFAGFTAGYRLLRRAAGQGRHEGSEVDYPFNLSGSRPLVPLPLAAEPHCPRSCAASRRAAGDR